MQLHLVLVFFMLFNCQLFAAETEVLDPNKMMISDKYTNWYNLDSEGKIIESKFTFRYHDLKYQKDQISQVTILRVSNRQREAVNRLIMAAVENNQCLKFDSSLSAINKEEHIRLISVVACNTNELEYLEIDPSKNSLDLEKVEISSAFGFRNKLNYKLYYSRKEGGTHQNDPLKKRDDGVTLKFPLCRFGPEVLPQVLQIVNSFEKGSSIRFFQSHLKNGKIQQNLIGDTLKLIRKARNENIERDRIILED